MCVNCWFLCWFDLNSCWTRGCGSCSSYASSHPMLHHPPHPSPSTGLGLEFKGGYVEGSGTEILLTFLGTSSGYVAAAT